MVANTDHAISTVLIGTLCITFEKIEVVNDSK